jgi:hypothetical protein
MTTRTSPARLTRDATRLATLAGALPGATAVTLAHRLPLLAGLGSEAALSQTAELWRMTFEKPIAFWQAWAASATLPLQVASLWAAGSGRPDLALRLAAAGIAATRAGLTPIHASVTGNARRLSRRGRARARSRRRG